MIAAQKQTCIVIAHRLSTIRNADKIVVVSKGEIAEVGTHSELIQMAGVYKKLVQRQLMKEVLAADDNEPITDKIQEIKENIN